MTWKDEEEDDIVVSSNGELQAALEECPGAPNSNLKMKVTGEVITSFCRGFLMVEWWALSSEITCKKTL